MSDPKESQALLGRTSNETFDDSELPGLPQTSRGRTIRAWLRIKTPWHQQVAIAIAVFVITSIFWALLFLLCQATLQSCAAGGVEHQHISNDHIHHEHHDHKVPGVHLPKPKILQGAQFLRCGNTVEESRSLGCKYDILSNHYVPTQCMDEASVNIYQQDESWYGYYDRERTQLINSTEEMGEAKVYYTNMRDHIVHCAALWKKQFTAFYEDRKHMDSLILDAQHTFHCADFLVAMTDKGEDFRQIPIDVVVGHAGCWTIGGGHS